MQAPEPFVQHEELELFSSDGTKLFAQRWAPTQGKPKAEVLVVHGYADHGGRYRELAHAFADAGLATTAIDLRGHGKSAGRRGYCDRFDQYLDDVEAGLGAVSSSPVFLLGHSFGALVSLDLVSRRPEAANLAGFVLSNPFLSVALPVPAIKLFAGKLAGKLYPKLAIPTGMPAETMSHDGAMVEAYKTDPFVFNTATAGWFRETLVAQARVQTLEKLPVPFYYLYSDSNPVASPAANRALAARLQHADRQVEERQGELHEILNELDRKALHGKVRDWILARL